MFEAASPSVRPRLPGVGEVASLLGEAFGHRFQLAQLELSEVRDRALLLAILCGIAAAIALLAGLALTLVFASLVWESEHRTWWMLGLTAFYFAVTGLIIWRVRRHVAQWKPFSETKFQLDQDSDCLARLLRSYRQS